MFAELALIVVSVIAAPLLSPAMGPALAIMMGAFLTLPALLLGAALGAYSVGPRAPVVAAAARGALVGTVLVLLIALLWAPRYGTDPERDGIEFLIGIGLPVVAVLGAVIGARVLRPTPPRNSSE
jgi:hypothetical protein